MAAAEGQRVEMETLDLPSAALTVRRKIQVGQITKLLTSWSADGQMFCWESKPADWLVIFYQLVICELFPP